MSSDWNTREWNFGEVKENSKLEFNFIYQKPEHTIRSVTTSCGCTSTMRNKNTVTAELSTGKVLNNEKKIKNVNLEVVTSDGLTHKLYLKATVVK